MRANREVRREKSWDFRF
jgi:hypothetical protein